MSAKVGELESVRSWKTGDRNREVEDFAYAIEPGAALFLLTAVFALLIAFLTVAQQAFKAATENPVKALRNE